MQKIECPVCWQDWLQWYRKKGTDLTFLLCPECDSVWLPGSEPGRDAARDLTDVVGNPPVGETEWDLIEPADVS